MTNQITNSKFSSADFSRSRSPVIIIGAGRSGTNMLRDLLDSLPGFATWPCDEINYIWRHGNRGFETDQFTREMADDKTSRYIQNQFRKFQKQHPEATVVEKTCANSLRCGFVHEVFPSAKFIHIIRDGRDVAASASLRWNAKLDVGYILKKARYVPASDLPWYASKYLSARVYKLISGKSRLSTWGPRFDGMQAAFGENELPVACAIQWKACVTAARQQLAVLPSDQLLTIKYEEFTENPVAGMNEVLDYLGVPVPETTVEAMVKGVSSRSVGNWEKQLSDENVAAIREAAGGLLDELGYV